MHSIIYDFTEAKVERFHEVGGRQMATLKKHSGILYLTIMQKFTDNNSNKTAGLNVHPFL
jgi:hypothetical protein